MEDKIDAALTCDKGCGHTVDYETCYAHQVQKVKNLLLEARIDEVKKARSMWVNAPDDSDFIVANGERLAELQEMLNHE